MVVKELPIVVKVVAGDVLEFAVHANDRETAELLALKEAKKITDARLANLQILFGLERGDPQGLAILPPEGA